MKFSLFGYEVCIGVSNTIVEVPTQQLNLSIKDTTKGNTFDRIKEVIHKLCGNPIEEITLESTSDSLRFDSLDEVELLLELEDEFDIPINDYEYECCVTIKDLVGVIDKILERGKKIEKWLLLSQAL